MSRDTKQSELPMPVQPISTHESPSHTKPEDVAIEELGHKVTLPRTLTSRIGIIGTISTVVCPWPTALSVAPLCLADGGSGGLLIGFIIAAVFMTLVYYLIAEKLPLYVLTKRWLTKSYDYADTHRTPTAGGQYHMVLKLAPPKHQRFLSYICGFILCFTWESFFTVSAWLFGMNISAMVTIWTGAYETYYTFVPAVFVLVVSCVANLTWGKHMNILEALVLVVQFTTFFLILVLLGMASGTHTLPASFSFETTTGWPNWAGALLGLSYTTGVLGGFDCATHLSEDTEDPKSEIPKSLLISTSVNSFSCIVIAILVTLCAGDANLFTGSLALSGHPLGFVMQLFVDATRGNKSTACAVFGLSSIIFAVSCINSTTTSSRMLFSLIRDGRDPYVSRWMAKDLNEEGLPKRCVAIAAALPILLLWINFRSSVGFQAIVSQTALALIITYSMVIICSTYSRTHHPEVLGRDRNGWLQPGTHLGVVLDMIALVFLFIIGLLCCIPFAPHPNAAGWNYAPFVVLAVILIGLLVWVFSARKYYRPGRGY